MDLIFWQRCLAGCLGRVTDARVQIAFSTWIRAVYYIRNSRLAMSATPGKVPERMSEVGDWPYEEHGVTQILSQGSVMK